MKSVPGSLSGQIRKATTATLGVTLATLMMATGTSPAAAAASTRVKTWGQNSEGQLGNGLIVDDRRTPVTAAGLTTAGVVSVAAGDDFNLALLSNGTVEAWGDDFRGQLGDGNSGVGVDRLTPGTVAGLFNITAVAAGADHSLALRSDGTVWAWGDDTSGQLGDGTIGPADNPRPIQVPGLTGIVAIAAGGDHSLALRSDGVLFAWGDDSAGQLGDGTVGGANATPGPVVGLDGPVRRIAAGSLHSLALLADGSIDAWGDDTFGQLGDGTANVGGDASPDLVVGLDGAATRIAAGARHSLALLADGTVDAWGDDSDGQLGDGTANVGGDASPDLVVGPGGTGVLSGVFAIAAGGSHSLALASNQPVHSWGSNSNGQLGNGSTADSPFPVGIRTGVSGLVSVSAGSQHSVVA
ncbi:RCC1 domain-containing protein [Streptosporangium sp. NPDC000396]|uniref:RCC1 domain-containing protein n=1 Tax=Streptosporangium sp. NPDC000396 TaxID=3366185 RepID=UPI0036989D5C